MWTDYFRVDWKGVALRASWGVFVLAFAAACQPTERKLAGAEPAPRAVGAPAIAAADWTDNPQGWVDLTWEVSTAAEWSGGEMRAVAASDTGIALSSAAAKRYPARGAWTSAAVEPGLSFTELLPSWNVNAPPQTGLALEVRARGVETGEWSPWLRIGEWGQVENWRGGPTSFDGGKVEIDVLRLSKPADAFQVKVTLQSHDPDPAVTPTLRRLVVVTSGIDAEKAAAQAAELETQRPAASAWVRDLPVPFYTQQDNPAALRPRTCSPTSTSMVMAYRGVDLPITENALGIYDPEYAIFGNWGRAVAWASQHGLEGELVRLRDWRQVEALIADGQPIIASIRFAPGTFPSNVLNGTAGHLIVIRGLTEDGDAIVNDPASATRGDGIVYKKEELAAAWFGNGGVAYLIREPS